MWGLDVKNSVCFILSNMYSLSSKIWQQNTFDSINLVLPNGVYITSSDCRFVLQTYSVDRFTK